MIDYLTIPSKQIGILKRVLVMDVKNNKDNKKIPTERTALLNISSDYEEDAVHSPDDIIRSKSMNIDDNIFVSLVKINHNLYYDNAIVL